MMKQTATLQAQSIFSVRMEKIKVSAKDIRAAAEYLKAGDRVLLSGHIYTARDAAHKRMVSSLKNGESLPFPLKDAVIYYTGPTPAKNGLAVGSSGPTTSSRMDIFTPTLLLNGLSAMIGKGERSEDVIQSIKENRAIYFCAVGGAGALYSKNIKSCEVIAYPELGCESIKRFFVEDMPLIVAVDAFGTNIFNLQRDL